MLKIWHTVRQIANYYTCRQYCVGSADKLERFVELLRETDSLDLSDLSGLGKQLQGYREQKEGFSCLNEREQNYNQNANEDEIPHFEKLDQLAKEAQLAQVQTQVFLLESRREPLFEEELTTLQKQRKITAKINRCNNLEEAVGFMKERSDHVNAIHLAAFVQQLVQFAHNSTLKDRWQILRYVKQLFHVFSGQLMSLEGGQLAQVVQGFGKLGLGHELEGWQVQVLIDRIVDVGDGLSSKNVSMIAHGVCLLGVFDMRALETISQSLCTRIEENLSIQNTNSINDPVNGEHVAITLWAFAKMGYQDGILIGTIQKYVKFNLESLSPRDISLIAWAYAKLGCKKNDVFEMLINNYAAKQLGKFSALDVSNLIWACGKFGFQSLAFRSQFDIFVSTNKWKFEQIQLVQVLAALVDLGWHDDFTILQLIKMLKEKVRLIRPHMLPLTIITLSHLDIRDKQLLCDLSAQCVNYLSQFSPQQISKMCLTFAKMNHYDHQFFDAVVNETMLKIQDFKVSEVADIVWSLAKMEHTYNYIQLYSCIYRRLEKVCAPISIENMFDLIQGFRKLNVVDLSELNSVFSQYIPNYLLSELSPREVAMLTHVVQNTKNEMEAWGEAISQLVQQIQLNVKLMNYMELEGLLDGLLNFSEILDGKHVSLLRETVIVRFQQLQQELTESEVANLIECLRQLGWLGNELNN